MASIEFCDPWINIIKQLVSQRHPEINLITRPTLLQSKPTTTILINISHTTTTVDVRTYNFTNLHLNKEHKGYLSKHFNAIYLQKRNRFIKLYSAVRVRPTQTNQDYNLQRQPSIKELHKFMDKLFVYLSSGRNFYMRRTMDNTLFSCAVLRPTTNDSCPFSLIVRLTWLKERAKGWLSTRNFTFFSPDDDDPFQGVLIHLSIHYSTCRALMTICDQSEQGSGWLLHNKKGKGGVGGRCLSVYYLVQLLSPSLSLSLSPTDITCYDQWEHL